MREGGSAETASGDAPHVAAVANAVPVDAAACLRRSCARASDARCTCIAAASACPPALLPALCASVQAQAQAQARAVSAARLQVAASKHGWSGLGRAQASLQHTATPFSMP
ncbi:hypothetical protein SVAN01_00236 [Stagonosporopsis vannaccii]|nr:hypothetical protein SVAN01_00236 [Stagonosporopsis vannaccii]